MADRAGHGVAVLLKVYAGRIDGDSGSINERIGRAIEQSRRGNNGMASSEGALSEG